MNFSQLYFSKLLTDITAEDVIKFFKVEQEETETLEFKSFSIKETFDSQLNKSVIRTLSAFLNSSGGMLIWGSPIGAKLEGKKEDIFIGDLTPLNELKEKDSLINTIASRISPLPVGIKVNIIQHDQGYIYIFEVTESISKPHQWNSQYMTRLDGQSKPAPHYLIDALFKQIKYPDLCGYIKFNRLESHNGYYYLNFTIYIINFSHFQNDTNVSFQLNCSPGFLTANTKTSYHSEEYKVIHYGRPISESHGIKISETHSSNAKNIIKVSLAFGGVTSPAKSSMYQLNLGNKNESKNNANYLIETKEENIFFSEKLEKLGTNKEVFIKTLLDRD